MKRLLPIMLILLFISTIVFIFIMAEYIYTYNIPDNIKHIELAVDQRINHSTTKTKQIEIKETLNIDNKKYVLLDRC